MALAQPLVKGMYRRGDTWWFRYTPAGGGAQLRESLKTADENLAANRALRIIREAPLERVAEMEAEREAYLSAGASSGELSRHTVRSRRYALAKFSAFINPKPADPEERHVGTRLADITTPNIERWLAHVRQQGQSPSSLYAYLVHLKAFCTWLVKKNRLRESPARKVTLGKLVLKGRRNFQAKEKIRDIIAAAQNDEMRFILFCGFHAGMRKTEIMEARPEWFQLSSDSKRGCINIQETPTYRPKDKEERTVPLTAEFEAFLRGYLARLPADGAWCIRPHKKKGPTALYRVNFQRRYDDLMKAQKVKCAMHDMRRSFVSNKLIDDSSLIFKLAKWTGTSVVLLQKHYAHLLADDDDIEAGV